ncbi:MAG: PilZ domain-containing protein [Thermodesulfobacteriota bacterium]
MLERRRQARFKRQFSVTFKSKQDVFEGVVRDVSDGGLFIITDKVLPPKSTIDLEFMLFSGEPINCRGTIIWVNNGQLETYPPGFGVEFLEIDGHDLSRLITFNGGDLRNQSFFLSA